MSGPGLPGASGASLPAPWQEAADAPLLDPGAFARLREWGGDELLGKMLALYLQNAPARRAEVVDGLAAGDPDRVERGAHALKSSSGNLGAERLRRLCQLVEDAGEDGRLEDVQALLPLFEDAFGETIKAFAGRPRGAAAEGPVEASPSPDPSS